MQIANPVDDAAQGGRLYGRRTTAVRVLSVGMAPPALHTGDMASDTRATAFVTGAAGFIGTALVKALVARRHVVLGLTPTLDAAARSVRPARCR